MIPRHNFQTFAYFELANLPQRFFVQHPTQNYYVVIWPKQWWPKVVSVNRFICTDFKQCPDLGSADFVVFDWVQGNQNIVRVLRIWKSAVLLLIMWQGILPVVAKRARDSSWRPPRTRQASIHRYFWTLLDRHNTLNSPSYVKLTNKEWILNYRLCTEHPRLYGL